MTMLLKLGQINGESTRVGYEKWIEVESMHFDTGRSISCATASSSRQVGEPAVSDVTFTKPATIDSGDLFFQSLAGDAMTAQVHVINTTSKGENKPYFKLDLEGVLISNYTVKSSGDRPTETFSLNFTKMKYQYDQYDGEKLIASGSQKSWDMTQAKEW